MNKPSLAPIALDLGVDLKNITHKVLGGKNINICSESSFFSNGQRCLISATNVGFPTTPTQHCSHNVAIDDQKHHLSEVPMPIGSMYGIFIYIYHKNQPNVGKYTIHGSYGIVSR